MLVYNLANSPMADSNPFLLAVLIIFLFVCIGYCLALLRGKQLDRRLEAGEVAKNADSEGFDDVAKILRDYSIGGWGRVFKDFFALMKKLRTPGGFAKEVAGVFAVQLAKRLATDEGRKYVADQLSAAQAVAERAVAKSSTASSTAGS